MSQRGSPSPGCSPAAAGPLKYFPSCSQINDSRASRLLVSLFVFFSFLRGENNLLSGMCSYGLPTRTHYAPFYAGLLFPFYGSMK